MLKLDLKTGTLFSQTKIKADLTINTTQNSCPENRIERKSMIVKIKLNNTKAQKLAHLMDSNVSSSPISQNPPRDGKNDLACPDRNLTRPIHPLFLGKLSGHESQSSKEATKGVLPLSESSLNRNSGKTDQNSTKISPNSQDATLSCTKETRNFSTSSKITAISEIKKFSAATEPAWPWKGISHIRGLTREEELLSHELEHKPINSFPGKKSKEKVVNISFTENIIQSLSNHLTVSSVVSSIQNIDSETLPPIPSSVRLPVKHLESGLHAQRRLKKQLDSRMQLPTPRDLSSSEDDIPSSCIRSKKPAHPALAKAFTSVATSLSAFDKGECETRAWAQKHSPKKAEEVLQTGCEALILRNWLSNMTIGSFDVVSSETKQSTNLKSGPPNKKRRHTKLDGSIISTDDYESDYLDEIEDLVEYNYCKSLKKINRTVVRGGKLSMKKNRPSKNYSTILISGPHGCGKSAAVYAAAKELDFDVFEINSSSKRSGKDILDKIGDMMMNHHVPNKATKTQKGNTNKHGKRSDDSSVVEAEINCQGNINSFFRSNSSNTESENLTKLDKIVCLNSSQSRSRICNDGIKAKIHTKPSKNQKQSLILIEEADIIFKEDIHFWTTIENIVAISKRPVIITCNDESIIPLSYNILYAILRFQPPPVELAVDYMLMIAASEGHIIHREAVKALYEERRLDLRASICELNFWCQFAIGDINRGLSWYYLRQQDELDDAECSNRIRVISENTYEKGMGWISQDILESDLSHLDIEEEVLNQTCEYWNFDIGDWEKSIDLVKWAENFHNLCNNKSKQLLALNMFADYMESMSDSDLISDSLFGSENQLILDPCAPTIPRKIHEEYPLGYKIIETEPIVRYCPTAKSISLFLRSRARNLLQVPQHVDNEFEIQPELSSPNESRVIDLIRKKCTDPPENIQNIVFRRAFDPLSYRDMQYQSNFCSFVEFSQFDRSQRIVSEDLAPYVRGIVAHDSRLQRERERVSNLVCEGGLGGKRRRSTRKTVIALRNGTRSETRHGRYFGNTLNPNFVEKTGLPNWMEAILRLQDRLKLAAEEHKNCNVLSS